MNPSMSWKVSLPKLESHQSHQLKYPPVSRSPEMIHQYWPRAHNLSVQLTPQKSIALNETMERRRLQVRGGCPLDKTRSLIMSLSNNFYLLFIHDAANLHRTCIFTFDSLGSRHPQVFDKLSAYLKMEARYKKGIDVTGTILAKASPVYSPASIFDSDLHVTSVIGSAPDKLLGLRYLPPSFCSNLHRRSEKICKHDHGIVYHSVWICCTEPVVDLSNTRFWDQCLLAHR